DEWTLKPRGQWAVDSGQRIANRDDDFAGHWPLTTDHYSSPASAPTPRGTSRQVTVASQTTLPSTYALPSRRAAVIRQARPTTSIRSSSPGTTGRRNRAFSIPVHTLSISS